MINKLLPKGFKFESYETVKRQIEQARQSAKQPPVKRRKEENSKNDEGKAKKATEKKPEPKPATELPDGQAAPPKRSGRPRKVPLEEGAIAASDKKNAPANGTKQN